MASALAPWMLVAALLAQAPAELVPASEKEIAAAIERLASENFTEREKATDFLWSQGETVSPALQAALKSTDAEVRIRAATILDRFKQGIYFDTPAASAAMIRQYRDGNPSMKIQAIQQLQQLQDWKTLSRLVATETDPAVRVQLQNVLRGEMTRKVATAIEAGEFAEAQRLLAFNASLGDATARRQLVTMLLVQGELPARLAALQKEEDKDSTGERARLILAMAHAAGDVRAADAAIAKLPDPNLPLQVAIDRRDWATAAKLYDKLLFPTAGVPNIEQIGYSALYHRLSGNEALAEERLQGLEAIAAANPPSRWLTQEILLLNERIDEVIEPLKATRPTMAIELLCVRQDFERGLAIANVKPGQTYDAAWFDALPAGDVGGGDALQQLNRRHILALQAAFFLHQIGETKDSAAIFTFLTELGKGKTDGTAAHRRSEIARIKARLGLEEPALAVDAEGANGVASSQVLIQMFGKQGTNAVNWNAFLVQHRMDIPAGERLAVIRKLLRPTAEQKKSDDYKAFVEGALAKLAEDRATAKPARIDAIAEVYLARGMRKEAIEILSREDATSATLKMKAGDLLREEGRYEEAIATYTLKAAPGPVSAVNDRQRALLSYLRGICEEAVGKAEAGEKSKQAALMLATDNYARQLLITGLTTRGLAKDAARVFDVFDRTSPDLSRTSARAAGDAIVEVDPRAAAAYWEQTLVMYTSSASAITIDADYITLPHALHRAKALAALADGDKTAFAKEIAACTKLLPRETTLVTDLVPRLDKAGWKAEADQLFNDRIVEMRALAKKYPTSAKFANALAWSSAVCRRNLDEGLVEAKRAVELMPQASGYIDTLAEVHHARGEYAEAVAAARKAVELSPDSAVLKEQLKKFEAAANK